MSPVVVVVLSIALLPFCPCHHRAARRRAAPYRRYAALRLVARRRRHAVRCRLHTYSKKY